RTDLVGMKILIADDDTATRKLYREVLELRHFAVEEARTGRECVDLARSHRPSLIVLDLHMPILDGFSAARELKTHSGTRSIPIVAVSGASRDHETRSDTATRKLYREVLELRHFAVEEARTGRECVDLARSHRPSLIVLDLHMPILDGFSAARELKTHSGTRSIPIVAVSGASRDHET